MKITITNYGTTYSVETKNDDVNAFEAFEYAMNLLKQVYHPDNIDDAICDKADDLGAIWPDDDEKLDEVMETTDALQDCLREGQDNAEKSNILCKQDSSNIL